MGWIVRWWAADTVLIVVSRDARIRPVVMLLRKDLRKDDMLIGNNLGTSAAE